MKKYIIAIALCFACFTLSAQQTIYVIDNVTVKNFDGSQLQGKTIKDYQISTQGSGKKAVTVHAITTGVVENDGAAPRVFIRSTTTSAEDPVIVIDGKRFEDASVLKSLDPQQIKSITVLKNEASLKEYDAPNGVIVVELKDPAAE